MSNNENQIYGQIKEILTTARAKAYSAVNFAMVEAYWLIGKQIVEAQAGTEPAVWKTYKEKLSACPDGDKQFLVISKPEFYERAKKAYCVVATGETERFANIIIRKGIIK